MSIGNMSLQVPTRDCTPGIDHSSNTDSQSVNDGNSTTVFTRARSGWSTTPPDGTSGDSIHHQPLPQVQSDASKTFTESILTDKTSVDDEVCLTDDEINQLIASCEESEELNQRCLDALDTLDVLDALDALDALDEMGFSESAWSQGTDGTDPPNNLDPPPATDNTDTLQNQSQKVERSDQRASQTVQQPLADQTLEETPVESPVLYTPVQGDGGFRSHLRALRDQPGDAVTTIKGEQFNNYLGKLGVGTFAQMNPSSQTLETTTGAKVKFEIDNSGDINLELVGKKLNWFERKFAKSQGFDSNDAGTVLTWKLAGGDPASTKDTTTPYGLKVSDFDITDNGIRFYKAKDPSSQPKTSETTKS